MPEPITTFRKLLAPITSEEFFADYYGKKPLHVKGDPDRVREICTWEEFNNLLSMTDVWSDATFKVVRDREIIAASAYCKPSANRDGMRVMQPDPVRVAEFLADGASIVLNQVETLTPGIRAAMEALHMATATRATCNAYCSQNQRQAFPPHFDATEVFAIHIAGEKTWNVYHGRFEEPLDMPGYQQPSFSPEYHDKAKGELAMEVHMTPGDLLYLPKGVYHDALASSQACLHLSFGLTEPRGLDLMRWLLDSLDELPIMRQAMPPYDETEAHDAHVKKIAVEVSKVLSIDDLASQFRTEQRIQAYANLTSLQYPDPSASARYRVKNLHVQLKRRGSDWQVVSPKGRCNCPAEDETFVRWMLARDHFNRTDFLADFPDANPQKLLEVVELLSAIGVVEAL